MGRKHRSDHEIINEALNLDGDPDKVRRFYDRWAGDYDTDVGGNSYAGPRVSAGLLDKHVGLLAPKNRAELKILDAGCGTGLAGRELKTIGYRRIMGFDLSPEMAARAHATGHYEEAIGDVDMMKAEEHYDAGAFDGVVCVGVFTLGHVPPEALRVLVRLLRPGGLLVVSTRTEYYDETDYARVADDLIKNGSMRLIEAIESAHYVDGSRSHFFAYQSAG